MTIWTSTTYLRDVPQRMPSPGYVYEDGPAIALPQAEHRLIPNLRGEYTGTAEDLFARGIDNLRNFTNAPEEAIEELTPLFRGLLD